MTRQEAEKAIEIGYERALAMIAKGIKCLIVGEMGIGNTTASSAILSVILNQNLDELVGIGTGISEEGRKIKQQVIERSIKARQPNPNDPLDVLSKVGGLEIAAMAGAMLAAAENRIPILVDGFICSTAAVIAKCIHPTAADYMFIGHRSVEKGHSKAIRFLEKTHFFN